MSLYRDALLIRGHASERHASTHHVLDPALVAVAAGALHELGEGQRPYSNLVSAAPKLRHDVMREELRVAPRHAHADVSHAQKPVESVEVLVMPDFHAYLILVSKSVLLSSFAVCGITSQ